jgi:hypothetical protein
MRIAALIFVALTILAVAPNAQAVDTRCGISTSAVVGTTIPFQPQVHDEFDYLLRIELSLKYYLYWGISIGGGAGYQYGEGLPQRYFVDDEWVEFDSTGTSFWRSIPFFATLRVEFWRKGIFNPYIGGGGGITYLNIYRKGYVLHQPVSNGHDEWDPNYFGLVGFDITLGKYVAILLEGRYSGLPTQDDFFKHYNFGGIDLLSGLTIYF